PSPHPPTAESPQKNAADPAIALPTFSFTTVYADETGTVSQQIEAQAVYFTEHLDEQVSFDMVKIPGGVFTLESPDAMGQSSECPPCRITVPSFYLGKYVVTQALYERIMGVNPATQYDPNQFVAPDKPVVGVRWQDAIAFCQKLTQRTGRNYRLPSEAEWEYACRAETQTAYYFGNKIAPDLANYGLNIDQTAKVGRYPPNGFGLFEMHGNVWEWCADHWHDNYRQTQIPAGSPPVNSSPTGLPPEGQPWTQDGHQGYRVIRGGSWCDVPENCRSASRRRCSIDAQSRTNQPAICFSNRIGFRIVVSTLSPQPQLASCAPKDESDEVITEILPPPSDPVALMTVDLIPPHNGSTAESPSLVELAQLAITPDLNLPSQSSSLPPQPQSEPMTSASITSASIPSASITSASIPSASITSASMASAPMNSSQPYVFATPQVNNRGVIVKQIQQEAVSFTEILKDGPYFTLLQIPGGTLMMGSLDGEGRAVERPQHQVTIPPFWMSQHLVTQAVYGAIMGHNPSLFQGDNRPVEKVSWYDAIAFCSHLSQQTGRRYSLPSEAVWEYACRANGHTKYTFGDALAPELANYNKSLNQTSDVGCYVPNGFGIFDLHGNVWEWCADNWHQNYHGAPTDGRSWETGYSYRVVRGGSWNLNSRFCRSAYRNRLHAHISDPTVGFRVVLMESDSRGDRPNFP
ncbi:MAG: formylglycine-generating enzyme family protein, partial [Leptolyngbyaceae cyanobacterium]